MSTQAKPYATYQGLRVAEHVVLQELVQHVEEVVLDQRLDDQLVQVVLWTKRELNTGPCGSATARERLAG